MLYVILGRMGVNTVIRYLARFYLQSLQSISLPLFARDFVVLVDLGSAQWQFSVFLVCFVAVFAIKIFSFSAFAVLNFAPLSD